MVTTYQDPDHYKECVEYKRDHVCAHCGGILAVVYNEERRRYVIVCGNHPEHKGGKPNITDVQVIKRGELDKVSGPGTQESVEHALATEPKLNPLMPREDVATRIPLSPVQIRLLQEFAADIGLKYNLGTFASIRAGPTSRLTAITTSRPSGG